MATRILFTDGSVDPGRRIGVGAALLVGEEWLERDVKLIEAADVAARTVTKRFTQTSSTRLELETAMWALREFASEGRSLRLFTDSQGVARLSSRRRRLEEGGFVSKSSGAELRHADLYREFFNLQDELGFEVVKVTGHADYRYQDAAHRIFHYVDREARRQLKRWLRELERGGGGAWT